MRIVMAKRTVGVQLIIYGKRTREDLPGVLDDVAAAGFQAVETGFLGEQVSGKEFKTMLDDRGLVHVGVHFGGMHLDRLGPVLDWMAETGGTEIPLSDNTLVDAPLELYKQRGQEYTEAAVKCAEAGITVSYHNHSWEFVPRDGRLPIEVLYESVDPDLVKACIDVYWVRDGGVDPAEFVAKYADRLRILHAKDSYLDEVGQRSFAPVGSGVLDFPAIMAAAEPSPYPWIVVEQDVPNPGETAQSCCVASRSYVRDTLGV
jgi:sugar phosphate isomerase/epimerase